MFENRPATAKRIEDVLLIWKFRHGSKEALARIYEKYESGLLTLAANLLGEPNAAEDVLQDVFISFVQSQDKFRLTGSLKGYLATCVANRSRDHLRRKQRLKTAPLDEAQHVGANSDGPVKLAENNEQKQQLQQALTQLPYEQREVVSLHLHGDLKFRQIAKLQNVSIKTAQSRYRYGLDKLRSLLDGEVTK
jgi:RNA polymerase sigma-70 factor (ECF subfamily)